MELFLSENNIPYRKSDYAHQKSNVNELLPPERREGEGG